MTWSWLELDSLSLKLFPLFKCENVLYLIDGLMYVRRRNLAEGPCWHGNKDKNALQLISSSFSARAAYCGIFFATMGTKWRGTSEGVYFCTWQFPNSVVFASPGAKPLIWGTKVGGVIRAESNFATPLSGGISPIDAVSGPPENFQSMCLLVRFHWKWFKRYQLN